MSKTDKSIEILGEVIQTSRVIGPEKTKQALIDARSNTKYLDKTIGDLIKKHLCKTFKISIDKLMNGTSKGTRTDALMVGYVLAKKHLEYKLEEIAILFKKDYSNVSKQITAFNKLNSSNKNEKSLIDIHDKISVAITLYKTSNAQWQGEVN
jgi:chromosomal replication initiation ATPase DnaA